MRARIAESRRLLADPVLSAHPGTHVAAGATDAAYEQWAARYDDPGNGLFDLDEPVLDEVLDALPVGAALDAACGTGRLAARLVERGHRVVGVDASAPMLDRARRRLPTARFLLGDLQGLPVDDASADLVVCGLALSHVRDLAPVYAELARVLRPGGSLLVSDVQADLVLLGSVVTAVGPDGQPQLAATYRHTAVDHLQEALAAGLDVRRCEALPRPVRELAPGPQQGTPASAPEPPARTEDVGDWRQWPWTLLGLAPEASRAAWDGPAVVVWHFQLDRHGR